MSLLSRCLKSIAMTTVTCFISVNLENPPVTCKKMMMLMNIWNNVLLCNLYQASFRPLYATFIITVTGGARAAYNPIAVIPESFCQFVNLLFSSHTERNVSISCTRSL